MTGAVCFAGDEAFPPSSGAMRVAFGNLSGRVQFMLKRFSERLWVKPLLASVLSVAGVFAAKAADGTALADIVPAITVESIQTLLSIMASSVLVIASLAVASMVSAYASASNTASPRAFPLVVADDRSQYALSAFVATFIYSIVGLIASKNEYFGPAGRFVLFAMTLLVLTMVVLMFVTWIDRIARLGRMGVTIQQVERAAARSLQDRRDMPFLGGQPQYAPSTNGVALHAAEVGFLQHIDMSGLQDAAITANVRLEIAALPGTFITPDRPIACYVSTSPVDADTLRDMIQKHFVIGRDRTFEDDPRFGLIVLSQIAGRALSPAINDPGTAIDVIGVAVRLLVDWNAPRTEHEPHAVRYDRISVPPLKADDMFDDAFIAIERDGANAIEVIVRLLRALETLSQLGDPFMRAAARRHVSRIVALAEHATHLQEDRELIAQRAAFA
jgi:uncharacterized membrane protein